MSEELNLIKTFKLQFMWEEQLEELLKAFLEFFETDYSGLLLGIFQREEDRWVIKYSTNADYFVNEYDRENFYELSIERVEPNLMLAFDKRIHLTTMESLINFVEVAITNLDTLRRREYEISILQEISKDLAASLELRRIAFQIAGRTKVILGARKAFYFHYSRSTRSFVCIGHWKYGDEISFTLDKTLVNEIVNSSHTDLINDAFAHQVSQIGPAVLWQPFTTEEKGKHGLVGLLWLGEKWSGGYTPDESSLLEMIANQSVSALLNADRYQEILEIKAALEQELNPRFTYEEIIGKSPAMQGVFRTIDKIVQAEKPTTVLIRGETGTGKELIARAIHRKSNRKDGPLISVNCGAIPVQLLESELFGHEKGAFTDAKSEKKGKFELAGKGTIFLDEVGELPMDAQVKLLRVLQERKVERIGGEESIEVDVRVIAATNRDLEEEIRAGTFREDLYYRLNVIPVDLPPLKERRDDIPLLINHFVRKHALNLDAETQVISPDALQLMTAYNWPGNIRELENIIERILILENLPIEPKDLPRELSTGATDATTTDSVEDDLRVAAGFDEAALLKVFRKEKFNISRVATRIARSRDRLKDYLKGICFKVYVESNFDVETASDDIADGKPIRNKVRNILNGYLDNLESEARPHRAELGADRSRSEVYRNLIRKIPIEYQEYFDKVLDRILLS